MSNMSNYGSPGILSSFHSALDSIVKERLSDTFRRGDYPQRSKPRSLNGTGRSQSPTESYVRESEGNMLTMGLIGCLPDNVQQAIKSFSIRPAKQHITFAFPFMEETIRSCCDNRDCSEVGEHSAKHSFGSSVLFFDECLQVIHGFHTYVTVISHQSKSSLPVVLLTLYQRDTTEGVCRHFQSLMRIMLEKRTAAGLWKLPTMVAELTPKYKEMVLDVCAETVAELHADNLSHAFPGKTGEQLVLLAKEKLLRPYLVSYRELLRRNIQEIVRHLTTTDPAYFLSVLDLLQAATCSILDYKKIDMMFKSPGIDPAIREFWRVWGHEQIARRVFPVTMATTPLSKLGPLYGRYGCGGVSTSNAEAVVTVGSLSHVPVKEGLQSVIKCLKSQDISQPKPREDQHENKLQSCSCSVCKIQPHTSRTTRLRLYSEMSSKPSTGSAEGSAFHLPSQSRTVSGDHRQPFSARPTFRVQPSTLPYPSLCSSDSSRIREYAPFQATCTKSPELAYDTPQSFTDTVSQKSAYSSRHLVQPVPHYFPLNLKAFSQPVMYSYPMINKPQYSLSLSAREAI